MWFQQILRTFFFSLDSILFNFIPTVYDLLITISRTSILTQGQIKIFAERIQMLLGVFMLFKVSFSLVTYIINPDDFSDKSKGFGKLWLNIIISLILLVTVPYMFNMAYQFQGMLLEENTLATLILGEDENGSDSNYINTAGQTMAFTVMLPFFLPNSSYDGLESCISILNSAGDANEECFKAMYTRGEGLDPNVVDVSMENYKLGIMKQSLGLTFRLDVAKITLNGSEGGFLIDYKPPISTAVAVCILLLLITFCMDVALRSIKLSFLHLIYPIPVISFIDPKSGKDGLFKKWYEMCFKTYISLFVRLIALYFGIYIISKVNGLTDIVNGSQIDDFLVKIFIIIGVLMFVKQLPKILEGLGFKLDGDGKFQLNPFKKFEDEAIGGKQILNAGKGLGATALAAGAAGGSNLLNIGNRISSSIRNAEAKGKGKAGAVIGGIVSGLILSPVGGIIGGARRGLGGTLRGEKFGQIYSNSYSGAMKARRKREDRKADGVSWYEPIGSSIKQTLGMHTNSDVAKSVNDDFTSFKSTYDQLTGIINSVDDQAWSDYDPNTHVYTSFTGGAKALSKRIEEMKATKIDPSQFIDASGNLDSVAYDTAYNSWQGEIKALEDALKRRQDSVVRDVASGTLKLGDGNNSAIIDASSSLRKTADRITTQGRKIEPKFTGIDSNKDISEMFKDYKAAQSQFAVSENAAHAQDVVQYTNGTGSSTNNGKK